MKKILRHRYKGVIASRIGSFFRYQIASFMAVLSPDKTDNRMHDKLQGRFIYLLTADDIGTITHKRWLKNRGYRKMNHSDLRNIFRAIRKHVIFMIEG